MVIKFHPILSVGATAGIWNEISHKKLQIGCRIQAASPRVNKKLKQGNLMVILFLLLLAVIYTIFLCIGTIAAALLESLIMYFPLIILCVLFNTAFIIQTVIAIISKIKKKKFGKGNIIRTIILGIITFVLFIISIILIFLKNFQAWKELFSSWVS